MPAIHQTQDIKMKATILVALFAALAAAAPQGATGPQRCGGKTGKTCHGKQVCAGEKEIKDGNGVCVTGKPCGNFFGDVCPQRGDRCVNDPRIECPEGVMDCGGGVCIPAQWVKELGLGN
ncbi:hypothetical protein Dda_2440 [Drechslerella dactyloides]|uniref:Uncharacterized protein n=1 Tax=Drechslerella dactyloides TaxID=74499 RepID=A0AAD6J3Y7_DREDA|nr:hypothetical protein Dda_2440 [Drechslerella dactyloides]